MYRYFKKAIQADRKSPLFFASYAQFLRDLGESADSEAHYLEALLRDSCAVGTLEEYARLLREMGEPEQAELFEKRARTVGRSGVTDSQHAVQYL